MTTSAEAQAAFEDAASRGFPNGDQISLQMAIYIAREQEKLAEVMAEPAAISIEEPPVSGPMLTAEEVPALLEPGNDQPPAQPTIESATDMALPVETVIYPDGTQATGVAPLPEQSPGTEEN